MEKKKLLLVAISVGAFLVIVIGGAILAIPPGKSGAVVSGAGGAVPAGEVILLPESSPGYGPEPALPGGPASLDAAEMAKNRETLQGIKAPPGGQSGGEDNFYITGNRNRVSGETAGETPVITVPPPSAPAVPDAAVAKQPPPAKQSAPALQAAPAGKAAPAPQPAASQADRKAPEPAATQAAKQPAPAKPAAKTPPAKQAAPAPGRNYWVQTGSFSAQSRAEGAKETLAEKGISSVIENRNMDGKTWYRVRVGPYTSQNEADYWLALIRSINGFENSLVWKANN